MERYPDTIYLWDYVPNGRKLLCKFIGLERYEKGIYENKQAGMFEEFGKRLKILYSSHRGYPDAFIKELKVKNNFGVILVTGYSKEKVEDRLRNYGWRFPRSGDISDSDGFGSSRIHFIQSYKSGDYYSLISNFDVVVIRKGRIPKNFVVYVFSLDDKSKYIKSGILSNDHEIRILDSKLGTRITYTNLWYQLVGKKIIGVGNSKFYNGDWFKALQKYATESLFNSNGVLNLKLLNAHVVRVNCAIPNCFGYVNDSEYWHQHYEDEYLTESLVNYGMLKSGKIGISFGDCIKIKVKYIDKQERVFVICERYYNKYIKGVTNFKSFDPKLLYFISSYFGVVYKIVLEEIVDIIFLSFMPSIHYDRFSTILELRSRTRSPFLLTCVGQRHTLKSSFAKFISDNYPNVHVIDSNDYGVYLANKIIENNIPNDFQVTKDHDIFYSYFCNIFSKYVNVKVSSCPLKVLEDIDVTVDVSQFLAYATRIYEKGVGSDGIGINMYVSNEVEKHLNASAIIIMCHNHVEARLLTSNFTISVRPISKVNEDLVRRNIQRDLNLAELLGEMFLDLLDSSLIDYQLIKFGYGDVLRALSL